MSRNERKEVLKEARELTIDCGKVVGNELLSAEMDIESMSLIVRTMKLCIRLMDYAESQQEQLDSIEDMNRSILNEVRKLQQKEGGR